MSADVFRQATPRRKLSNTHREMLIDGSGILPGIVKNRGYYSLEPVNIQLLIGAEVLPKGTINAESWLGIPLYRPDGSYHCDIVRVYGGSAEERHKYCWPKGFRNALDVHPDALDSLDDEAYELGFTEGIKKTDALLSAAMREGIKLVPVALMGPYGWRSKNAPGSAVVPDVYDLPLGKRIMHVISDSDYRFNDDVRKGWNDAVRFFSSKNPDTEFNAKTRLIIVPPQGSEKQGADDFISKGRSVAELLALGASPDFLADEAQNPDMSAHIPILYHRGLEILRGAEADISYLMEPIMPEASITLLAGDTGTYKTWAAMSLMLDGAFGYDWNGHPGMKEPVEPFGSLYVNKEMGGQMMAVRLRQLVNAEEYANNADFDTIVQQHIMVVEDKELDLAKEIHRNRLEDLIIETGAKLIILDSMSMCWTGDENKASEVAEFFMQLRGITERHNVCWVLIHHLVKPQTKGRSVDKFLVRGSGQIVQQSDTVVLFSLYDTIEPLEEGARLIAVHHAKTRTTMELPAWAVAFNTNDGLFFNMKYAGLLAEIKAKEYSKTTDPHKLMAWAIQAMSTMSGLKASTGSPGLRTGNLISLLSATWPTTEGKPPSEATIRRVVNTLAEKGHLSCVEENRHTGNLYQLTDEQIVGSSEEDS